MFQSTRKESEVFEGRRTKDEVICQTVLTSAKKVACSVGSRFDVLCKSRIRSVARRLQYLNGEFSGNSKKSKFESALLKDIILCPWPCYAFLTEIKTAAMTDDSSDYKNEKHNTNL
jgi:hypothetical protein